MKKLLKTFGVIAALALMPVVVKAYEDARLMRYPDINGNQIVFVYAGNIWTVDANGGNARQLTSHKGIELFPKISPDGKWIAFSAEYSGSRQVYIMPSQGGTPKQLTFYNDIGEMPPRGGYDYVILGWTSDSKNVFFRANRTPYGDRIGNYYTVSIDGGFEQELPIPHGGLADLSPDNKKIVFTYIDREFRTWKRYKGGRASNLWIYDLEKNDSEEITDFKGTDHIPTWFGDKIYFASDRDQWLNIHSYNVISKQVKQVTHHEKFDAMWPSGSNGQIAYEVGGHLYKLDLETEQTQKVEVNIKYDNATTIPYFKNVKDNIHSATISPKGNRVLFDARGDIFSVPAGEGTIHNLTNKQGVRSVYPQWSPNGKWIAYHSDETGEYEVYLLENKENAVAKQVTKNSKGWKYAASWSPNSKMLVFFDRSMRLQLLNVETEKLTVVDTPTSNEIRDYTFSPDSKWIAYTKDSKNGQGAIWVYNTENGKKQQLTNDAFGDRNPVFSECGNYIYFVSNRDFNLKFSDFEFNYLYADAARIYAVALRNESPRLFEPKETVESTEEDKKPNKDEVKAEVNVTIEFDGINQRIMAFPLSSGSYWDLQPVANGLVYFNSDGMQRYNIKEQKNETIMPGIRGATVSTDGKKFLYNSRGDYGVASLAPNQKVGEGKLDLSDLTLRIEPRKEWEQIFVDGWRIFRDYFYVSNLHNVDWDGFREKYSELLPYVNHRFDLDYIFGEIIAETNTGHSYANYGDFERVKRIDNGLLGAKLTADKGNKRYIISKIFDGENWNSARRSPLTEQGIDIKEGEYLIQIDGQDVTTSQNPYQFLENKANKSVRLTVNSKPTSQGARTYTVRPIACEQELMYLDWVNSRREMVDKLSGGRIGYMHVPNTAVEGNRELHRGMYAYNHKDALIIDERFNGGGFIPDRMVELLNRTTHAHWHRAGLPDPMRTPGLAHEGPKAMLINQYGSSGGDAFPYFFRQKNLGTIIGSRTWGGLVGMSGNASLMDGGYIAVPRFGIYNDKGEWIIEGIGIYPDIEVIDEPHLLFQGKDPSIEKAVEVLLKQLEENPPREWPVPADPDRSGWIEVEIE
ncbi:MAG: PDZ domain-containing protein [Bacteroidales bacterium]|nr:PDZ domain-containing protein [Bacteroidales bacterium]MDD4673017.1 PDZ domain-containing protein [Bacteroidales bacterium]MDY0348356.1 PDZ domain-containing protein [Tenuifilaceae bacterium]